MAFNLDQTQEIAVNNVVNRFSITRLENNIEKGYIEITYRLYYSDMTPYKSSRIYLDGYDAVKALYTEIDAKIATGLTFEQASSEILYAKVLTELSK